MENYNQFDARGQVVFVEPTWVTGDTCLFNIHDRVEYLKAKSKVTKLRKDFLLRLEK